MAESFTAWAFAELNSQKKILKKIKKEVLISPLENFALNNHCFKRTVFCL
jgi:hypothetical protein